MAAVLAVGLTVGPAQAITVVQGPTVTGQAEYIAPGDFPWLYSYTLSNNQGAQPVGFQPAQTHGGVVIGWVLPIYTNQLEGLIDPESVQTPDGWGAIAGDGDLWDEIYDPALDPKGSYDGIPASRFIDPDYFLAFITEGEGLPVDESLGGFAFRAARPPTDSPVVLVAQTGEQEWAFVIGDPPNPTAPPTAVPEPATAGLLASAGMVGLICGRRRR